jgi:hypothetical protein
MAQRADPGATTLNRHNWFPVMTLMVGNPGETDEDCKATLDLLYEVNAAACLPSLCPRSLRRCTIRASRPNRSTGEPELTPLQWQIMMKCWKLSLRPALHSWWGPWHGG